MSSDIEHEIDGRFATTGSNLLPRFSREPAAFRHSCDATAEGAARFLRRIDRFDESLLELFERKVAQRVRIEREFCEFLLGERKKVHHRDVGAWKQNVAESLSLTMGRRIGKDVIEERLTRAYAAEVDPEFWDKLASACIIARSLDLRRSMARRLKAAEDPAPSSDTDGEVEDPDEETVAASGAPDVAVGHVAAEVLDAIGANDAADPVEVARQLREEVERLRAENERLRAENEQLRAARTSSLSARPATLDPGAPRRRYRLLPHRGRHDHSALTRHRARRWRHDRRAARAPSPTRRDGRRTEVDGPSDC